MVWGVVYEHGMMCSLVWGSVVFFVFKQRTAYGISACLVGSEMGIRDRANAAYRKRGLMACLGATVASSACKDGGPQFRRVVSTSLCWCCRL